MRNNLQKTANYPLLDYYPRFLNNIRQWNRRRKLKQHQTGIKITLNRCAFNLIIKKILAELSFILDLLLNHKHRSVYPHGANRRRLSRLFLPFFFLFPPPSLNGGEMATRRLYRYRSIDSTELLPIRLRDKVASREEKLSSWREKSASLVQRPTICAN